MPCVRWVAPVPVAPVAWVSAFALLLALIVVGVPMEANAQEEAAAAPAGASAGAGGMPGGGDVRPLSDAAGRGGFGPPKPEESGHKVGARLGWSQFDGDQYIDLLLLYEFSISQFGLGVQLPLHFLVFDRKPKMGSKNIWGGVFRKQEWDEWKDWLKIIRYIRWGQKGDFLYFRAGTLERASIGHGTILANYYNNIRADHHRPGLQFDVNTSYGGVETIINDFLKPNLVGGRAYVRPLRFVFDEGVLSRPSVGFTVLTDFNAPKAVLCDDGAGGRIECTATNTQVAMDQYRYPYTRDGQITMVGADLDWQVIDWDMWKLTPYNDNNFVVLREGGFGGYGFHLGVLNRFPIMESFGLEARFEYRYFTKGYMPTYYGPGYELERETMPGAPFPQPKLAYRAGIAGKNGWYGEAAMYIFNILHLGATLEDYQGKKNGAMLIYAVVPALEWAEFSAYYHRWAFDLMDPSDAFALDDRSLVAVAARFKLYKFIGIYGSWSRTWVLKPEGSGYKGTDSFDAGITFDFAF